MSRVLLAVAIDDWGMGPFAAKEAAAIRLEPLGNVKVLRVKVEEDEQLGFVPNSGTRKERMK